MAAASAGLALGVTSQAEKHSAEDKSISYDEAQHHADAASSRALGANILFGVAGAAAVTTGVLFYLGWRRHRAVSATVVPSVSGAMVRLELRR